MAAIQDVDEVTFVEEPLDIHHECLVCLQLLREPWILECCGHHLCKPCIDKLIRDRKGCPHCRGRFRYMRDRNHERILLGKQVYCRYKDKGCEWQGALREVNRHCSTRLRCEWCNLKLLCYEVEQHNTVCVVANEIIKCELHSFGCLETFPRMSIQAHMQSNCHEHVNLLKQAYEDLSSRIAPLQNENAKLIDELTRVNAGATVLRDLIYKLSIEKDEITEKLNDLRVKVISLHNEIRRYKLVAVSIFFVGIALQHFIPTLFNIIVRLLVVILSVYLINYLLL